MARTIAILLFLKTLTRALQESLRHGIARTAASEGSDAGVVKTTLIRYRECRALAQLQSEIEGTRARGVHWHAV